MSEATSDAERLAEEVVRALESGEAAEVGKRFGDELKVALPPESLDERWRSALDQAVGSPRRVAWTFEVSDAPPAGCVILEGPSGKLPVTVRFDAQQLVTSIEGSPWREDGIRNIVIACPEDEGAGRTLADFYSALFGMQIVREDWLKIGKDATTYPQLAFDGGYSTERPVKWPDPEFPQQVHLDAFVSDMEAGDQLVLRLGATLLQDAGGHRVYVDPIGHPFCLYPDPAAGDGPAETGRLGRIVFDCSDARSLAAFYSGLLDTHEVTEESPGLVVVGAQSSAPTLAFQSVERYVSPRWHDPSAPQQMHLDLHSNNPGATAELAARLGAVPLPPPRGSCPVYDDPAGHPFCLCSPGR